MYPMPRSIHSRALCSTASVATANLLMLALSGCNGGSDNQAAPKAPVVRTANVSVSDSAQDLVLSGQLDADVSVAVSFGAMGTVQKVLVGEGQAVKQGQVLAILEAGSLQDQLAAARSKAVQADDAYGRMEPMHKNGTVPDIKWVEVETGREQARSMVSMATRNLDDATLRSPLSGIVAKRSIEPGEKASPGVAAFTVVQTGTMLATVAVAEKDVSRLKVGAPAWISVAATRQKLAGKVREIGVSADPFTRTYKVKVAVPNPGGELRVGMVADVRLRVPGGRPAVIVPPSAVLVDENDRRFVWVLKKDVVQRRFVRITGFLQEGEAVDSGLASGEAVVVSGTPMLSDGISVRVGN
jgi:RND family efflux transporter MFP subunit